MWNNEKLSQVIVGWVLLAAAVADDKFKFVLVCRGPIGVFPSIFLVTHFCFSIDFDGTCPM